MVKPDDNALISPVRNEKRRIASCLGLTQTTLSGIPRLDQRLVSLNLRLIDWENFGPWGPAAEIAMVFEAFGLDFSPNQEEEFLKTYSGIRQDATLAERLGVSRPLVRFEQLTWAARHVFEIFNGEMDRAFAEATEMSKHLAFVNSCLRCVKTGLINLEPDTASELRVFPPEVV